MMVQTYLRRGQRTLERMMLDPTVRRVSAVTGWAFSGLLLSGVQLAQSPQPLALGLICSRSGWQAAVISLGAMVGYVGFWGMAGRQGLVWAAAAGTLAVLLGGKEEPRQQPLMIPAITAFLTGLTGLVFLLFLREAVTLPLFALRLAVCFGSGVLFTQAARQRDAVTDWLVGGIAVLALARVGPVPWLRLGYIAAGLIGIRNPFPAAVLAGLGLDLAQVTEVPMTAVLTAAGLIRMIPFDKKWQHYASAGFACLGVMAALGVWDSAPLPGLLLGGGMAALLPPKPGAVRRQGETGAAQVRLELSAQVLARTRLLILEAESPPVDQQAVFRRAAERACGSCSARNSCRDKDSLSPTLLADPTEADCRKPGRLRSEMYRGRDQLRCLQRERRQGLEYRQALLQQYRFLEAYLHSLADQLPRSSHKPLPAYRVEAAARSRGKERANGDRCLAFPGPDCRFYLLLCDGMGTGLEAAQEGDTAARLLRGLLGSGFPPEHALRSLNSLLILRHCSGAVTVDLAEVRLDTGQAAVYKWGAAPSWLLQRSGPKKIGTASPPPGLSMEGTRETVEKLSLCRGEPLILLSDGVDGEDVLHRLSLTPDAPPGELAADILEKGCTKAEDDATAAVLRLRPVSLGTS